MTEHSTAQHILPTIFSFKEISMVFQENLNYLQVSKKPFSVTAYHKDAHDYKHYNKISYFTSRVQFNSVPQSCPTLCNPMNHSMPGFPVHHQLPESTQTHVHWVCDAIQPSHPLSSPSPPALNLSQHQGLFKWVSSLHQVAKVLEFQLQHQSFQ